MSRRSLYDVANDRKFGRLKKPTGRQFDSFIRAWTKQNEELHDLREALKKERLRDHFEIKRIMPNATAELYAAATDVIESRRRTRDSIINNVYERLNIALEKINRNERLKELMK